MKKLTIAAAVALTMSLGVASAAKITVWTDFQSGGELEWLQNQAKAFQATPAAKGDTIEVVSLPNGELRDKFIQSAPKGQGPDLAATIPHDQIGQMVTAGVLEPVQKYIGVTDNAKNSQDAFNFEGKIFGFPMFGEAVAVVYNKKLVPTFPKTWDAFIKLAQSLTKPEQQQFGFLAPIGIQYHDAGIFFAYGAYVFGKNPNGSLNKNDIGLNNEGAVKAAQMIADLRFKYKLIPEGTED
ncbi:MAG TPA: extracellular solute-binding protein, partial [Deinococcales bacterium]|nr:extracellular solute-binding protein [Deinococcales bacterium]